MTKGSDESASPKAASAEHADRPEPTITNPAPAPVPAPEPASRRRRLPVRVIALAVIVGSVGAMAAVDRFVHRSTRELSKPSSSLIGPVATDPTTSLSTWFCAGGSLTDTKDDLVITIANPTDVETKGTVTFYGDGGERQAVEVDVPAKSQRTSSARDGCGQACGRPG